MNLKCWGREEIEEFERRQRMLRLSLAVGKFLGWGIVFMLGYVIGKAGVL